MTRHIVMVSTNIAARRSPRPQSLGVILAAALVSACGATAPPAAPVCPPSITTPAKASAPAPAPAPARAAPSNGPYDVIIIGAGISGLAAARELRHLGRTNILILEATDHIGGRAYVFQTGDGKVPIDLGGAWLHGVPTNPLTGIVDRLGFTRQRTDLRTPFFTPSGRASEEQIKAFHAAFAAFEEASERAALQVLAETAQRENGASIKAPTSDRAADYLPRPGDKHAAYKGLVEATAGPLESAAELDSTSVVDVTNFEAGEDDLIHEGMGNVVKKLGEEMISDPKSPLDVRLQTAVTSVRYGDKKVTVTAMKAGNTQVYEANRVLVTVSTGVLKAEKIKFEPKLPAKKWEAINALPMGLLNKIVFEFKEDVLGDDVEKNAWVLYTDKGAPPAAGEKAADKKAADKADKKAADKKAPEDKASSGAVMAFVLRPFASKRIAIGFFGGKRAADFESDCKKFVDAGELVPESPQRHACDERAIKTAKDALMKMFPKAALDKKAEPNVYVTRWGLVSWTKGSYSAATPGASSMHRELGFPVPFDPSKYDAEVDAEDRVFFAGEGCARPIYNGSFPGAFESGMKAAREIDNSLNDK